MNPYDPMDDEGDKLIEDLFDDPLSKMLSDIEKSIEGSIVKPDIFEPPVPYRLNSLVLGSHESAFRNEFNLGPDKGPGLYEVSTPPLRMSGGSRRPFKNRGLPGLSGRRQNPAIIPLNYEPERCPLNDYEWAVTECSYCMHYRTFFEFSHCELIEEEYLEAQEEEDED